MEQDYNDRLLHLYATDEVLGLLYKHLLEQANNNNSLNDNKIKQIVNKHFFDNNFDLKDIDVNDFIKIYLKDYTDDNDLKNKINSNKDFLYRFLYAIQDLKWNSTYIINGSENYVGKADIKKYKQKFPENILSLLEIAQLCPRLGLDCEVRQKTTGNMRPKSFNWDIKTAIGENVCKKIHIFDCNNYFKKGGYYNMDQRIKKNAFDFFYRNISESILRSVFDYKNDEKNKNIVVPTISVWSNKPEQDSKQICAEYFRTILRMINEKGFEEFKKQKIKLHIRTKEGTLNEFIDEVKKGKFDNILFNFKDKNKKQEIINDVIKCFSLFKHSTDVEFPSNDDNNDWFWVACGDHLAKYGNDYLDDMKNVALNENNIITNRVQNTGNNSDEYFNIRTNFFKFLGQDQFFNPGNWFSNDGFCRFSSNKLHMPINGFEIHDDKKIDTERYVLGYNDYKLEQILVKIKISHPDNNINILKLADDFNKNNDNKGFFEKKDNSGKHWSWWVFPSNTKTYKTLDFNEGDEIYKQIANSNIFLKAYTDILNYITNHLTMEEIHHIDFTKFLQCYSRINFEINKKKEKEIISIGQQTKFQIRFNDFLSKLDKTIQNEIKNDNSNKQKFEDQNNSWPLYDTKNATYNKYNKQLLLNLIENNIFRKLSTFSNNPTGKFIGAGGEADKELLNECNIIINAGDSGGKLGGSGINKGIKKFFKKNNFKPPKDINDNDIEEYNANGIYTFKNDNKSLKMLYAIGPDCSKTTKNDANSLSSYKSLAKSLINAFEALKKDNFIGKAYFPTLSTLAFAGDYKDEFILINALVLTEFMKENPKIRFKVNPDFYSYITKRLKNDKNDIQSINDVSVLDKSSKFLYDFSNMTYRQMRDLILNDKDIDVGQFRNEPPPDVNIINNNNNNNNNNKIQNNNNLGGVANNVNNNNNNNNNNLGSGANNVNNNNDNNLNNNNFGNLIHINNDNIKKDILNNKNNNNNKKNVIVKKKHDNKEIDYFKINDNKNYKVLKIKKQLIKENEPVYIKPKKNKNNQNDTQNDIILKDKQKYKERVGWKFIEYVYAVVLLLLLIAPGCYYIYNKNQEIDKKNEEIDKYNKNIDNNTSTDLNSTRDNSVSLS